MANNSLEIEISAKTDKATKSLDALVNRLNDVNNLLNSLNTTNIQNITNALNGLKSGSLGGGSGSGNGGANTTQKSANKITDAFKKLFSNTNRVDSSFRGLNSTMFKLASTWGMFYASVYPFIRLFQGVWKETQAAMDYVETYNYFKVSMGKIGKEAGKSYATKFYNQITNLNKKMTGFTLGSNGELFSNNDKSLGLDIEGLMNFQAKIGAVTNSVGLLGRASTATQKALSMLSADLSSLTNTDLDTVMTNLSSALIGQSRAVYRYGIDITNNTLKEYAEANAITKKVSAMTQAEKMQLRVLALLDQSKVAWGDQANTINSVANQYRVLKQQVANLGRTLGNLFLPIVQKVIPYINALIIVLRRLFEMLGFKIYGDNWLKDLNDGVSGADFGGIADDIGDMDEALDDADGSAKKLKKTLLGFDEINALNDPTTKSGSTSGGGGGFDLSDAIELALGDYESIWDKAFDDMFNKAEELARKLLDYFERGDFKGLGNAISHSLTKMLKQIPWEKIYKASEDFGKGYAEFLNGLINPNLFGELGKSIAGAINTKILSYKAFWTNFDGHNLGVSIASGINKFFREIKAKDLAEGLNAFVDTLEDALKGFLERINWSRIFSKVWDFISNLEFDTIVVLMLLKNWKKIASWGKGTLLPMIGKAILDFAKVNIPKLALEIGKRISIAIAGNDMLTMILMDLEILIGNIGAALLPMIGALAPFIILAVAGLFDAIHVSDAEMVNILGEDFEDLRDDIEDCADTLDNFSDKLAHTWDNYQGSLSDARADYSQIDTLIQRYDELTSKTDLSKKEQSDLKNVVDELCDRLPELNGYYNEENGLLDITTEELKELNKQKLEEAKLDAQKQMLTDYYRTYYESVDALEEAYGLYNQAVEQNAKDHEELDRKLQNHEINRWEYNKSLEASNQLVEDAQNMISDYSGKVDEAANKVNHWSGEIYGINDVVDKSSDVVKNASESIENNMQEVDGAIEEVDDTVNTLGDSYKETHGIIDQNEIKPRANTEALERILGFLDNIKQGFKDLAENGIVDFTASAVGKIVPKVKGYATGGMPSVGSLFIAGESGAEIVSHGSQGTGVMNESQMANAIRGAVVDGMMQVMMATNGNSTPSGSVEIPIYLDGREVARATADNMESLIRSGQIRPSWI